MRLKALEQVAPGPFVLFVADVLQSLSPIGHLVFAALHAVLTYVEAWGRRWPSAGLKERFALAMRGHKKGRLLEGDEKTFAGGLYGEGDME
ncbi:hypothetical protein [Denitrobacterium detoxificans]|uniref:hypothetical protein n=1 Tax=Denitrobacterium detoxificans TaxID=79604 RepID=UPI0026EB0360|nr:hypothetical protein [Denitrobacterium detoxificans]MBE6466691.1 hypothetical protein [Denitrobacterium detoxificans]